MTFDNHETLVERLKQENVAALGELYELYAKKIYNRCYFILKNKALAEDATQEVFLKAFQNIKSLKDPNSLGGWINRMAYNFCIDFIRKEKKNKQAESNIENFEQLTDFLTEMDTINQEKEIQKAVLAEIQLLTETERLVILLHYWEGTSVAEIAQQLNMGDSAVKMKLVRTRTKLKDRLKEKGINHSLEVSILMMLQLI